jgi:putative transposase
MDNIKTKLSIVPTRIQVDNGSEFISEDFDKRAYENNVTLALLKARIANG